MFCVSGWPDVSLMSAPREDQHQVWPQHPGLGPLLLPLCRGNVSYNLSWSHFIRWYLIIWSRCIPCALVPFCMTRFRVTEHYCSNCGILLGKYKGWKGKATPWGGLLSPTTPHLLPILTVHVQHSINTDNKIAEVICEPPSWYQVLIYICWKNIFLYLFNVTHIFTNNNPTW